MQIRLISRGIAMMGAIALATSMSACAGSSGNSDKIVARVAGVGSISKRMLDHWMPVEATLVYQEMPKRPVPRGVIPDPPSYTACIAYLRTVGNKLGTSGPPTTSQLRAECKRQYQNLKELTLNTLIGWDWTLGEGAALGMRVDDNEVRRRLATVNERLFSNNGEFKDYLKWTGQTVTDMLFRSRVQLFEVKIHEQLLAAGRHLPRSLTSHEREAALAKIVEKLPPNRAWVAKTSCEAGFIVSGCRQYRGSLSPGFPD
jgi:foldase protein PrsA